MKKTYYFFTASITKADIRYPTMFDDMKKAQKVLMKSPLFLLLAHIEMY
jgi:hypothetical protein